MNQTDQMGTGRVLPLLIRLAVPSVIAQVINLLYNIVDRIYIGHISGVGPAALTGVGLFMPFLMLLTAFATMIGSGGAPLASIALGQGRRDKAEQIVGSAFAALLLLAAILTPLLLVSTPQLLRLFGASDDTLPYALSYGRIYIGGAVFAMITVGMNVFISAQGFAGISMLTTVIGALLNIILDPILIFIFHMGVAGAAIATVLSQLVSAIWILLFLSGRKTNLRLRLPLIRINPEVLLPCLSLGISAFVMISTESLLSIAFNRSLSSYGGDIAVGAMTVIQSISSLVIMPIQGVTHGGQPLISYNFGARKNSRVKEAFRLILTTNILYAGLCWVIILVFTRPLASIFTNDAALLDFTVWAMRIYFAVVITLSFQMTCQNAFVALGQARVSLLLACLRKLILLIPLILLLPRLLSDRVFAVFLAEPISDAIAAAVTTTVFFMHFNGILGQGPKGGAGRG